MILTWLRRSCLVLPHHRVGEDGHHLARVVRHSHSVYHDLCATSQRGKNISCLLNGLVVSNALKHGSDTNLTYANKFVNPSYLT